MLMGGIAFVVFYWQSSNGVEENSARNVTLLLMGTVIVDCTVFDSSG